MTDNMREVVARWLHPTASGMRLPSPLPDVLPAYVEADPWQREAWKHYEKVAAELGHDNVAWGHVSMDMDEFEAAILATADEFERRMGVRPTVIDLPNWVRGTILEQIAFVNGFTIADRRDEPAD